MPAASVIKRFFRTKQEAIADINAEGFWPISWIDGPGETYAAHYHRSDERLYLVAGTMDFEDVSGGCRHRLEPGDKLVLRKQEHRIRILLCVEELVSHDTFPSVYGANPSTPGLLLVCQALEFFEVFGRR